MKILKFGGSSVSQPKSLNNILDVVNSFIQSNDPIVIVVSALQGVTDRLTLATRKARSKDSEYISVFEDIMKIHEELMDAVFDIDSRKSINAKISTFNTDLRRSLDVLFENDDSPSQQHDHILAFGELCAATIISQFMRDKKLDVDFLDARELIKTDSTFGNAKVDVSVTNNNIVNHIENDPGIKIVTGFIGSTSDGVTTTLGRGGSDYTATLFGIALQANCIMKWTDVDGIMSADPKVVGNSHSLDELSFSELFSLSKSGSGVVVHPEAIYPLAIMNIPFMIKNTNNPNFDGTRVSKVCENQVKIVSLNKKCHIIKLDKYDNNVNNTINEIKRHADLLLPMGLDHKGHLKYIVSGEELHSLDLNLCRQERLLPGYKNFICDEDQEVAVVTLINDVMPVKTTYKAAVSLLENSQIPVITYGSTPNSISFAVNSAYSFRATNILHTINSDILSNHQVIEDLASYSLT